MEKRWTIRDYQAGDEEKILTLYQEANNREMTLAHWHWKFAENPFGGAIIKLLFDGDKLIGHYAVMPMDVLVQGTSVKAALSANTMTHPDYRRRGIFVYLAEETYKQCRQEGIKFVYGFPNQNSYHGFVKRLMWRGFGNIIVLERDLPVRGKRAILNEAKLHAVDRFDERVTLLWNQVKSDYNIIVTRTENYLNWRFVRHPTVSYEKIVFTETADSLEGFMILKTYLSEDGAIGHIVDILSGNNDVIIQDFVNYALNCFTERKMKMLSCWVPKDSVYARILVREGFNRKEFNAYFGVRPLNEESAWAKSIKDLSNWHLTMGDLDII
jgi:GNAT superfamily N-acetyltransferase